MRDPDRHVDPATMRPNAATWGPLFAGISALIFAFPAGMALAIINWQRMGLLRKARFHVIGTLVAAYLFAVLFVFLFPVGLAQYLYPAVNIGVFFYLRREIDRDLDDYAHAGYAPRPASRIVGVLIGVGLGLTFLIVVGATAILLEALGLTRTS